MLETRRSGGGALVVASAVLLAGCGYGDARPDMFPVTGTISYGGKPVPAGYVMLKPDGSVGNDGLQAYAEISDGRFDTSDRGKGVTGGAYEITVHGFHKPEGKTPPAPLFNPYTRKLDISPETDVIELEVPVSDQPLMPVGGADVT